MNDESQNKRSSRNILLTLAKFILIPLVLYLVYVQLSKNWDEVLNYDWKVNYWLLILSIIMHLVTFVMFSKVWQILIAAFDHKVKLIHAFKIAYITNLGRYIPGKIWPVIGMSFLAKRLGINEEVSVTSWILAMVFSLPAAFLVGSIFIFISPELRSLELLVDVSIWLYILIASLFALSICLIVIPNKMFSLMNILLRRLKRQEIAFNISARTAFLVYGGYMICWVAYGFSFWLFVSSIASGSIIPAIPTIGGFIIAYQLGYLAFFAPGGVGVRELVLTGILGPYLGPIAAGIAVAARVWNMVVEISAAIIAWFIKMPDKKIE